VTGFKVTPIIRWKRRVVSALPSNLEFKSEILDVTLRPNGEWRTGFTFFGESDAIVPFTSPIHLWSDTSALEVDLSGGPGQDGPTGWIFDNLYPGMVAMFMGYPSTFSGSVDPRGRGLFVGWMVEQTGPGVSISNTPPDDFIQSDYSSDHGGIFPKDNHGPILVKDGALTRSQGRMVTPAGWTGTIRITPLIYKEETSEAQDIAFRWAIRKSRTDITDMLHPDKEWPFQGTSIPATSEGIYKMSDQALEFEVEFEQTFINVMVLRAGEQEPDTYEGDIYSEGWIVEYDPE
jgi:hypothetical protein